MTNEHRCWLSVPVDVDKQEFVRDSFTSKSIDLVLLVRGEAIEIMEH